MLLAAQAFAVEPMPHTFTSTTEAARFDALTHEIRCVVCQNQSLAESNAPLANDLREKIYLMVNEKKSDEAIKEYLVSRYGEFILLRPRFNTHTAILWLFPLFGLAAACLLLIRRWTSASPTA